MLRQLDWRPLVSIAVQYYEALWHYNDAEKKRRAEEAEEAANTETQYQATLRLVEERATENDTVPPLRTANVRSDIAVPMNG